MSISVLNALRHQRFGTAYNEPFRRGEWLCAQRLTASEVWHTNHLISLLKWYQCSTPYGIRGLARLLPQAIARVTIVLNALRHQRFGTQRHCAHVFRLRQVLNALRHQRFGTFGLTLSVSSPARCSTPYGIRGLARDRPCRQHRHEHVLNALRHQRFGTPKLYLSGSQRRGAQRLTASEVWHLRISTSSKLSPSSCSTPYGIRGLARLEKEKALNRFIVLNALRHQRFGTRPPLLFDA